MQRADWLKAEHLDEIARIVLLLATGPGYGALVSSGAADLLAASFSSGIASLIDILLGGSAQTDIQPQFDPNSSRPAREQRMRDVREALRRRRLFLVTCTGRRDNPAYLKNRSQSNAGR